jgi:hypothetical protein
MWRSLSGRQRIVAGVLTALVLAAGIYRWVAFGHLNEIRGGSGPTIGTVTGESEFLRPTIAEVDQSATSNARAEGTVHHLSCHEVPDNTWSCMLQFVGGLTVAYHGVWNYTRGTLAWSAMERKATVHFRAPIGQ